MSLWNRLRLGILYCIITRAVIVLCVNETEAIPPSNQKVTEGNNLWIDLARNCKNPSMACVKKTIYHYLDHLLDYSNDITIFTGVRLLKNNINYEDIDHNETNSIEDEVRGGSALEEVSDALRSKAVKFLMTHDVVLSLPEPFFEGGALTISPRTFDGDGALFKLDTAPVQGRIFLKKIKKFITTRLIIALVAIVLVIKLVVVKFLFLLPLLVGVAAAKKLLLKVLLFLFPALSHLFKLCPYYSPTKLHHHKHHISHIHHLSHLPSLHHGVELDHPPPGFSHGDDHAFDYYSEGPGVTDYHRKNFVDSGNHKPPEDTDQWYGGQGQTSTRRGTKVPPGKVLSPKEIENMIRQAEKEATLKARLQEEQKRVEADNKRLQDQIKQLVRVQEKLKLQQTILKENSKLTAANILQTANILPPAHLLHAAPGISGLPAGSIQQATYIPPGGIVPPPTYFQPPPVYQSPTQTIKTSTTPSPIGTEYDRFYSPILEKIDAVLVEIGYIDEPCRERLICSMYKNPEKFSPHSNLISAELSRDADELQKPTSSNLSVIRFYKYVQAARDGQDKRDCIRLYPTCPINTDA